jgi:hypothetical protein
MMDEQIDLWPGRQGGELLQQFEGVEHQVRGVG